MRRETLTLGEAGVVGAICFGYMSVGSIEAVFDGFPETPFTDDNSLYLIFIEAVFGAVALLYLRARRFDLSGLVPRPTVAGTGAGALIFLGTWIAGALVTAPFDYGLESQPIEQILAQSTLSGPVVVAVALVNGTFEEVFLLGVLVRGLRGYGLSLAIGLPLLLRVLCHLYQGPSGALWIAVFGLILSLAYVRSGSLWPPVFAHMLADVVPFAL